MTEEFLLYQHCARHLWKLIWTHVQRCYRAVIFADQSLPGVAYVISREYYIWKFDFKKLQCNCPNHLFEFLKLSFLTFYCLICKYFTDSWKNLIQVFCFIHAVKFLCYLDDITKNLIHFILKYVPSKVSC